MKRSQRSMHFSKDVKESIEEEEESSQLSQVSPIQSDERTPISRSGSYSSELSLPTSFEQYSPYPSRHTTPSKYQLLHFDTQLRSPIIKMKQSVSSPPINASNMLKLFYEKQVERIRYQLQSVTDIHHQLELTLQKERKEWNAKEEDIKKKHIEEMKKLEVINMKLKTDLLAMQKLLQTEKMEYISTSKTFQFTDTIIQHLKEMDEEDLSLKEFIQLQVYTLLSSLQEQIKVERKLKNDNEQMMKEYKEKVETIKNENFYIIQEKKKLEMQWRQSETLQKQHLLNFQALQEHIKNIEDKLKSKEAELQAYNITENWIDMKSRLENELNQTKTDLSITMEDANNVKRKYQDLKIAHDLIVADKSYLENINRQLEDDAIKLKDQITTAQAKLTEYEAHSLSNLQSSMQKHEDLRIAFESKLEKEVEKILAISSRELETVRQCSQLVSERETRLLQDARDELANQVAALEEKYLTSKTLLEEKTSEMLHHDAQHSMTISTLRNDLKIKEYELSQLGVVVEEKSNHVRQQKLEIDMLQQKLQIHKDEFARLERTSTLQMKQLETDLADERRRLQEYERLEVDLDASVLLTSDVKCDKNDKYSAEAMETLAAAPSRAKRRFQQSVSLAQQVVKAQSIAAKLENELVEVKVELENTTTERNRLRKQLQTLSQPHAYFLDQMSAKEKEVEAMKTTNDKLEEKIRELEEISHINLKEKRSLHNQLQHVLSRRQELDQLRHLVEKMKKNKEISISSTENKIDSPQKSLLALPAELLQRMTTSPECSLSPTGSIVKPQPKWYSKLHDKLH